MATEKEIENDDDLDKPISGWWIPTASQLLPPMPGSSSPEAYEEFLKNTMESEAFRQFDEDVENAPSRSLFDFIKKAVNPPPSAFSYARISTMPDYYNRGVVQWPGLPPLSIRKIAKENLAPLMIIGMRTDDVLRYANLSRRSEPWKPGWSIATEDPNMKPDKHIRSEIRDAERFLLNCNIEKTNYIDRGDAGYSSFRTFLGALTRDSLTYDGMAVFTDRDMAGRIRAFSVMSAQNVRLTAPGAGYNGDKSIFAVGMDEAGNIVQEFSRNDLIFHVRNPRADPDISFYGFSEIEMAVRLIQGMTNAIDYNIDSFNRNSVPNGMMIFYGSGWVRRTLDYLARLMTNAKRGNTKSWTVPFLAAPADGKVELMDFSKIKGSEAYYQDFINMMIGAFCTIYRFPATRIGYRVSGKGPDTSFNLKETGLTAADEADPGKEPLLGHLEHVLDIIVKSRWPHLKFQFHGKSPREDAREYEARILSMTQDEKRLAVGLSTMEERLSKEDREDPVLVRLAKIMGMAPVDPSQAGIYQNLASMAMGGSPGGPEAEFGSKKDPAVSEDHGHQSGVRRDSKKESTGKSRRKKTTKPPKVNPDIQTTRLD